MKRFTLIVFACLFACTVTAEENWRHKKGQEKRKVNDAAERYEHQADKLQAMAREETNPATRKKMEELAAKNRVLAEHKRKAAVSQSRGKDYDWSEYHQTQAEANQLWGDIRKDQNAAGKEWQKEHREAKGASDADVKKKMAKNKHQYTQEKEAAVKKEYKDPEVDMVPKKKTYQTESGFTIRTSL
jgi:hypothetical protein